MKEISARVAQRSLCNTGNMEKFETLSWLIGKGNDLKLSRRICIWKRITGLWCDRRLASAKCRMRRDYIASLPFAPLTWALQPSFVPFAWLIPEISPLGCPKEQLAHQIPVKHNKLIQPLSGLASSVWLHDSDSWGAIHETPYLQVIS